MSYEAFRLMVQGWASSGYLPEALAYGFVVNALLAGLLIGPVLGGFLTDYVSWRAIFYINLPVGVLTVLAATFLVRESRDTTVGRKVDVLGVGILTVGLTALVLALIEGNNWGWDSLAVLGLIFFSVVSLAWFVFTELTVKAPIVEFALFRSRNFIGSVTVAFIISFAMMGVFFFLARCGERIAQLRWRPHYFFSFFLLHQRQLPDRTPLAFQRGL